MDTAPASLVALAVTGEPRVVVVGKPPFPARPAKLRSEEPHSAAGEQRRADGSGG
jgi:hypothetical protein